MQTNETKIIKADTLRNSLKEWNFTYLDQSCAWMALRGTWVFSYALDPDALQAGLQLLLGYYPHLAGRMQGKRSIHLTNAGVPFTTATAPGITCRDIGSGAADPAQFNDNINLKTVRQGKAAPFQVRLTRIKDGCVLGVMCAHSCLDGVSFYTLADNWGRLCRGEAIRTPLLDQNLLPHITDIKRKDLLAKVAAMDWKKLSFPTVLKNLPALSPAKTSERSRGFYFSPAALAKLKKKYTREASCSCSTHEALSAYLTGKFTALVNLPSRQLCTIATVINFRDRLAGIPKDFTGNAAIVVAAAKFEAGSAPAEIAAAIHTGLQPYLQCPSPALTEEIRLTRELIHYKIFRLPFDPIRMHTNPPTVLYINNFHKLPVYTADFGCGKPFYVIPHNLPDPVLIWPAAPARGGVEVYFSGVLARAIAKLPPADPWLQELAGHMV